MERSSSSPAPVGTALRAVRQTVACSKTLRTVVRLRGRLPSASLRASSEASLPAPQIFRPANTLRRLSVFALLALAATSHAAGPGDVWPENVKAQRDPAALSQQLAAIETN